MAAPVLVRTISACVIPMIAPLAVIHPTVVFIGPGPNASAGPATFGIVTGAIAHLPTLAGADAHGCLVELVHLSHELLSIAHLLHELLKFFGGLGEGLRRAGLVALPHLRAGFLQFVGDLAIIAGGIHGIANFLHDFLQLLL